MRQSVYKLGNRTVELDGHARRSNDMDESQMRGLIFSFQKKASSILKIPAEAMPNMKEQAAHEAGLQALALVKLISALGDDSEAIVEAGRQLSKMNAIDDMMILKMNDDAARLEADEQLLQLNSYGVNSIIDRQLAAAGITGNQRTGRPPLLRTNAEDEVEFVPADDTGNVHFLAKRGHRSRISDEDIENMADQNVEKFFKDKRLSLGIFD